MKSYNPATGDLIYETNETSPSEIEEAVKKAKEAQTSWSSRSMVERYQILERYQKILIDNKETLAELIAKEVGKPLWEAKTEVDAMAAKIPISLEAHLERCKEVERELPVGLSTKRHRPRGVVAVFGPYNFPGHLPNGHIVPALLAGNCLLFKPSELTPLVGSRIVEFLHEAGVPKDVLQIVQGGKEVGKKLVEANLDGLFFTGSSQTGLALLEQLARHPEKILALEMGGNNPLVVGNISDLDAACYNIIQSAYLTTGQRCTAARRLILQKGSQPLIDLLAEKIKQIKIGPYTDEPEPFMGPLISEEAAKNILEGQKKMIEGGANAIVPCESKGGAFLTCGLVNVTHMSTRDDLELFGPLLQVITVDSPEAAIKEANNTRFGLSSAILTDDDSEWQRFYEASSAGIVNRNGPTNGALSSNPFGGTGLSGNGRPSAYYASDYCSYPVATLEKSKLKMPNKLSPGVPFDQL